MNRNALLDKAKNYIADRLIQTQRKFEVIYSTTADQKKKESILKSVNEIERDMKKLLNGRFAEDEMAKYHITFDELANYLENSQFQDVTKYKILRNIPIVRLNQFSKSRDINIIWSLLNYFGTEYMGLLSEQNLRLDYGHAFQRDSFFTNFNQIIRALSDYGKVLEQIEAAEANNIKDYKESLLKVQSKEYRDIIIKTGNFLFALQDFIEDIWRCESEGEKVFMEPEKIVEIKGVNSMLEGLMAKDALNDLLEFTHEFISYIKFPDLRKIEE